MTISYYRLGAGRGGVAEGEWLEIDPPGFRAWRQVAVGAVGHFGGALRADERDRVTRAIAMVDASRPPVIPTARPGSAVVTVDIDGRSISYGSGGAPDGPWAELDDCLRGICDAIVDRPTGAIAIETDPAEARLVHRGDDPIDVDLGDGSFVAVAWRGWYEEAGRIEGRLASAPTSAASGWSVDIPLDGLPVSDEVTVHVHARFRLGAEPDAVEVELAHAPALDRPHDG